MQISATITEAGSPFAPILFAGDPVESIHRAAPFGFDGVELHIGNPQACDYPAICDALQETGLKLTTVSTGRSYLEDGLSFCDPAPEMRSRAVARVKAVVDLFADLRPMVIIGLMRGFLSHAPSRAEGIGWIDEALAACAAHAARHGMVILVEMANRFELDYLHTAEEGCAVLDRVQAPNLKLLLDTFHMNIEERSFAEPLRTAAPHLGHVHFSDNNRRYPGAGMIDFKVILRVLREIGYAGPAAVECVPWPDPDTAARRALETLAAARDSTRQCVSGRHEDTET